MNIIESLKTFPLLANIREDELKVFASKLKEEVFPTGTSILVEGDTGDTMYLLIDGEVDVIKTTVYGEKFTCAKLKSSYHVLFGEIALIDNDKRSASIIATTECKCLSIDGKTFKDFCREYPNAGVELLLLICTNTAKNMRAENANLRLVYQALIDEIDAK